MIFLFKASDNSVVTICLGSHLCHLMFVSFFFISFCQIVTVCFTPKHCLLTLVSPTQRHLFTCSNTDRAATELAASAADLIAEKWKLITGRNMKCGSVIICCVYVLASLLSQSQFLLSHATVLALTNGSDTLRLATVG